MSFPRVVFVGGLPGSGKTSYVEQLRRDGWAIYDDFQAGARGHSPAFPMARTYGDLVQSLRGGDRCVVADTRVVCADYREDAERALRADVGPITVEWRIFENDPAQCARNVRAGADSRPPEPRLKIIAEYSSKHSLPSEAVRLPVWR